MRTLPILILGASFSMAHAETVQQICGLESAKVTKVKNLEDANASVCRIRDKHSSPGVQVLAQNSLNIIQSLKLVAGGTNAIESKELKGSLQKLAEQVSRERGPRTFTPTKSDAISNGLSSLYSTFGSEAQRWSNPQGYYEKLLSILKLTPMGKQVADCFEKQDSDRVAGREVEFVPRAESSGVFGSASAAFEVRAEDDGKYKKIITLDPGPNAGVSLATLAHELQHSCNTKEFIQVEDQMKALQDRESDLLLQGNLSYESITEQIKKESNELLKSNNLKFAIDEMRAYKLTPEIFKIFASYHPAMFCENFYLSSFLGRQVVSAGEYMSTIEAEFGEGNKFAYTLVNQYIKNNHYLIESFYDIDPNTFDVKRDPSGNPVFKDSVKKFFAENGFPIR